MNPIRLLEDRCAGKTRPSTLLVFLPPAEAQIEDYLHNGFISALRERHIHADVKIAGIGYEHVMQRTVAESLHDSVIQPANLEGYRYIWLVGISLGAFNALHYAAAHPERLAGLMLIAPYPGTNDILTEISEADGPRAWGASPLSRQGDERVWWRWLCHHKVPIYFATGTEDRFLRGQKMLASLLPEVQVRYAPGNHAWPTWRQLWEHWLDIGPLTAATGGPKV